MSDCFVYTVQGQQVCMYADTGYINLNQLALATGKRINNWVRLQETTSLLREFEILQSDTPDPKQRSVAMVKIKGSCRFGGGTWAHPDIAIQFAQWCDPACALLVCRWVREWASIGQDSLLNQDYTDYSESEFLESGGKEYHPDKAEIGLRFFKEIAKHIKIFETAQRIKIFETSRVMITHNRLAKVIGIRPSKIIEHSSYASEYLEDKILSDYAPDTLKYRGCSEKAILIILTHFAYDNRERINTSRARAACCAIAKWGVLGTCQRAKGEIPR